MKINIIGGGPAGLYFAILMKLQDAGHDITLLERDGPNDTFGWGIVFSDQTFNYLAALDLPSYARIIAACQLWDNVDIIHRGQNISIGGNGFSGVARLAFLQILRERCAGLGVKLQMAR